MHHAKFTSIQFEYEGSETSWFKMKFSSWELSPKRISQHFDHPVSDSPLYIVDEMINDKTIWKKDVDRDTMVLKISKSGMVQVDLKKSYLVFERDFIYLIVQVKVDKSVN